MFASLKIKKNASIFQINFLKPQKRPKFGILDLFPFFRLKILLVTEIRSRLPNFGHSSCKSGRLFGIRVVDPYSFFPDPDPVPEFDVGDQYGSGSGSRSGSNTDPGL
jgi:hypothetical protein